LEQTSRDQLDCGKISLKGYILTDDNISHIVINKKALAEYSQVEMFLRALPRDLGTKAVV
jgi:hypothetical protein